MKIVIALDGSRAAESVLPIVERHAAVTGAQVVLLHVVDPISLPASAVEETVASAERYLRRIGRALSLSGFPMVSLIRVGPPVATILDVVEEERPELLAMSAKGGTATGRVSELVLRWSPVPVLLTKDRPAKWKLRTVLVALDGSRPARAILPWAERLAAAHGANVRRFTAKSNAAREILREGRAADLIAMTTHGLGSPQHWTLGSVAASVIERSPVPILICGSALTGGRRRRRRRALTVV